MINSEFCFTVGSPLLPYADIWKWSIYVNCMKRGETQLSRQGNMYLFLVIRYWEHSRKDFRSYNRFSFKSNSWQEGRIVVIFDNHHESTVLSWAELPSQISWTTGFKRQLLACAGPDNEPHPEMQRWTVLGPIVLSSTNQVSSDKGFNWQGQLKYLLSLFLLWCHGAHSAVTWACSENQVLRGWVIFWVLRDHRRKTQELKSVNAFQICFKLTVPQMVTKKSILTLWLLGIHYAPQIFHCNKVGFFFHIQYCRIRN